jgi:hypothetical protein
MPGRVMQPPPQDDDMPVRAAFSSTRIARRRSKEPPSADVLLTGLFPILPSPTRPSPPTFGRRPSDMAKTSALECEKDLRSHLT